jgi:repressor LexA
LTGVELVFDTPCVMSEAAERVYEALGSLLAIGHNPSARELAAALRLSVSTVHTHLKTLRAAGWVAWMEGRTRSLRITGGPLHQACQDLDLRAFAVPAGPPASTLAVQDALDEAGRQGCQGQFMQLTARGDSMIGVGITDGTVLTVRVQCAADHGDVVVATVPGSTWPDREMTVKLLDKAGPRPRLLPANPGYEPIETDDISIVGKVTWPLSRRCS